MDFFKIYGKVQEIEAQEQAKLVSTPIKKEKGVEPETKPEDEPKAEEPKADEPKAEEQDETPKEQESEE